MTNNFSLLSMLENLGDEYVLLKKWDDFPSFTLGSDVDLLVMNRFEASLALQKYIPLMLNGEMSLRITEGNKHIHLDIVKENSNWLRIDLVDDLDFFSHFSIQDALKVKIFLSKKTIQYGKFQIHTPSKEFDILIRYFEYLEWFERRPDKIKHLDFILDNATKEEQEQLIIDSHRYIRFIHPHWIGDDNQKTPPFTSRKQAIKEIFRLLKYIFGMHQ